MGLAKGGARLAGNVLWLLMWLLLLLLLLRRLPLVALYLLLILLYIGLVHLWGMCRLSRLLNCRDALLQYRRCFSNCHILLWD